MAQKLLTQKKVTGLHVQSQYHLMTGAERLRVWEKARGMWKNRKPDPIKELKKMRKEWDRDLPWPKRK